jgi:ubiquinone/menaquinone biosynthesis C-methylase UbiE
MSDQTVGTAGSTPRFYGQVSGTMPVFYDRGLGPVFFADFADDLARRVAASMPLRVLETAAGTGIVTRRLRDLLPENAHVTASDLNLAMLEVARTKFRADEQVAFEPADATALPFPDGSFDAVVCQFGVMFFPDQGKAHREAHRVLAPGGRYVFSVWDGLRHNPIGSLVIELAAGFFPAEPPRFFEAPFSCHRIDPIRDALDEAGFTEIRIAVLSINKPIADVPGYAHALVHGSPLIDEVRARSGDPQQIVDALTEALPRAFGTDPPRIPLQAIVFAARRR